jgi:hypothetical protein
MNKRLIEYDLPLADISEASARRRDVHNAKDSVRQVER